MKALTILQPYAHWIAIGEKRVENRRWRTGMVGDLAIHAAGSRRDVMENDEKGWPDMFFGGIVAVVRLVACVHVADVREGVFDERFPWLQKHEHVEGPICWVFENVRRLPEPILCRGAQGLWTYGGDLSWSKLKHKEPSV